MVERGTSDYHRIDIEERSRPGRGAGLSGLSSDSCAPPGGSPAVTFAPGGDDVVFSGNAFRSAAPVTIRVDPSAAVPRCGTTAAPRRKAPRWISTTAAIDRPNHGTAPAERALEKARRRFDFANAYGTKSLENSNLPVRRCTFRAFLP